MGGFLRTPIKERVKTFSLGYPKTDLKRFTKSLDRFLTGGYQRNKTKTHERLLEILEMSDWKTLQEICLNLRLMPSTVREGIKILKESERLETKRIGKAIHYKLRQ